jgi:N-acetylglucosamine-6-phosphate deacetylase
VTTRSFRSIALFGSALTDGREIERCRVSIADGTFASIEPNATARPGDVVVDGWIAPGLIDLHVHGAGGVDLTAADDPERAVASVARSLARRGVTAFCPTVSSARAETYARAIPAYAPRAQEGGAESLGVNLEGPFIDPSHRGFQDATVLRPASAEEVARWIALGPPMIVTLAPERPRGMEALRELVAAGVVVSLGHSGANAEQARAALAEGARHGTHLFNAMPELHHREPGLVGALLGSDATVEVIADGIHLHPQVVELVVRVAGPHRVCLVTDGLAAMGEPPGRSRMGDEWVISDGRAVRREDGTLAGTAVSLDECLRNARRWLPWLEPAVVLRMATSTPASVFGRTVAERKGRIAPGYDADAILLDREWNVTRTYVRGVAIS